jgi:hypothetical protein
MGTREAHPGLPVGEVSVCGRNRAADADAPVLGRPGRAECRSTVPATARDTTRGRPTEDNSADRVGKALERGHWPLGARRPARSASAGVSRGAPARAGDREPAPARLAVGPSSSMVPRLARRTRRHPREHDARAQIVRPGHSLTPAAGTVCKAPARRPLLSRPTIAGSARETATRILGRPREKDHSNPACNTTMSCARAGQRRRRRPTRLRRSDVHQIVGSHTQ